MIVECGKVRYKNVLLHIFKLFFSIFSTLKYKLECYLFIFIHRLNIFLYEYAYYNLIGININNL